MVRGINFDLLKQYLSPILSDTEEAYTFDWVGKKASIIEANKPIHKTLRPVPEKSKNWDATENIYIEGDNLEALKLLQESYLGKVKMIYIDPPYNTGNDFIYRDDFAMDKEEYDEGQGLFDEETGDRLFRNSDSNGRFHSDWCSMIYSRLLLARNLLSEDGVIFISIDDNEVENLKKICNEVFGENNFLTCVTRATGTPTGGGFDGLVNELDYMLIFAKNVASASINGLPMNEEDSKIYDLQDDKGRYLIRPLRRTGGEDRREDRPTMYFPITAPDGSKVFPIGPTGYQSRWICSPETAKRLEDNGLLAWKLTEKNGMKKWSVYQKFYLENRTKAPGNLWNDVEGNKKATRDIRNIFDGNKVFEFPKPVGFIKKVLQIGSNPDSVVLDFFSGSATTADAVMQMNAENDGKRKFILIQLPEKCDEKSEAYKSGFKTIPDIGEERIRRAGARIEKEAEEKGAKAPDTGFRVFKVDDSNMKPVYYAADDYSQAMLDGLESNIKEDRTDLDLLFGCLVDWGLPLSKRYRSEEIDGVTVHDYDNGVLVACFAENVPESVIKAIARKQPLRVVFRDSCFADSAAKINLAEIFKMLSPDTTIKVL